MAKAVKTTIKVGDQTLPIDIYVESRRGLRASLGKHAVIMRVPRGEKKNMDAHYQTVQAWLAKLQVSKPHVFDRYLLSSIKDREEITFLGRDTFYLNYEEVDGMTASVRRAGNQLILSMPSVLDDFQKRKESKKLLSRMATSLYKAEVKERLLQWNASSLQKEIKSLTLRYNSTNWGSCSTGKRINLSTRSLLLPLPALDYVLVHELCHLVEMNHSQRFWSQVEQIMPDYLEHEKWIKKYGSKIDF